MLAELRSLVIAEDYSAIADMAEIHRRTLSYLTALSYDRDTTIAWGAIHAMGQAAARLVSDHPEFIRSHLRRLLWSLSDESGGIGWHAPELLAEIVRQCPDDFNEFAPLVFNLLEMEADQDTIRFLPGTLWACGRLAPVFPNLARAALLRITAALKDPRPQVRGMAIWCLGQLNDPQFFPQIENYAADRGTLLFNNGSRLVRTTIGELVSEIITG